MVSAEVGELRAAWLVLQRAAAAIRRRLPQALAIAGLAAAAVLLRLALRPDRYEARGLLQVGLNVDVNQDEDFRFAGTAARAFLSQVELLSSERVFTEALFAAGGAEIPPGRARDEALDDWKDHVTVRPVRNTFLVEVEAWDPVPAQAARRVNALFEVYVRVSNEFLGERYRVQNAQAQRREQDALEALRAADARREAFLTGYGDVAFEPRANALAVRSGELEARAARIDVERASIAAEASLVALNLDPTADEAPEVLLGRLGFLLQAKEIMEPLRDARSALAEVEAGLEPEHPLVQLRRQQLEAQGASLRASVRTLSLGRQEDLRCRAGTLESERAETARLLAELERERFRMTELQSNLERLEREVAYYERELETTRDSQWRAEGRSQIELAAAVLAAAEVPHEPTSPFTPLALGVIALGALALGGLGVIVWDRVDDTLRQDDDLAGADLSVLARIPALAPGQDEGALVQALAADGPPTLSGEAFRLLRTNALHALGGPARPTLLVTSAVPGEGKSIAAASLAAIMARTDGPALLIEADLRRPRLARLLGVEAGVGLAQVLLAQRELADAVAPTSIEGLSLLPAGLSPASNPSDLLGAGALAGILEAARARYRTIIIDTPPALGMADASLLAPRVDGVLFVVRLGHARRRDVLASLAQLRAVGARLAGLVLTGHAEPPAYLPYGMAPLEPDGAAV